MNSFRNFKAMLLNNKNENDNPTNNSNIYRNLQL